MVATMNEIEFVFQGDERARSYALRIARAMVRLFDIPISEAIGRINREWKNKRIIGPNLVYHQDTEYWAKRTYYEPGTYWWVEKWMAENTPKPKPYP